MSNKSGNIHPPRIAISHYLCAWYAKLAADTPAMDEYINRGAAQAIAWAPDRLVDAADEMLDAYRRNDNEGPPGHKSKFPMVLVGMSRDYTPTPGDRGRQMARQLIKINDDAPNNPASIYGYRQAMGDKRTQIVIFAAESATATSLAAQFSLFIADVANRRFYADFVWGEYTARMPITLETPDIQFNEVPTDEKNICILAADLNFTITTPFFDAPKIGEPNDGSNHNPPGYPVISVVTSIASGSALGIRTTDIGSVPFDPLHDLPMP